MNDRPQSQSKVLLTVEEAARTLSLGRTSVFGLIKTGELESVRLGRLRRIPADSIDAYVGRLTHAQ